MLIIAVFHFSVSWLVIAKSHEVSGFAVSGYVYSHRFLCVQFNSGELPEIHCTDPQNTPLYDYKWSADSY